MKLTIYIKLILVNCYLLISSPYVLLCQNARSFVGKVINKKNQEPLPDVHVIVLNSSLATYTNERGYFSFPKSAVAGVDIAFSHISFDVVTETIPMEVPDDMIFELAPNENIIETVTVKSQKSNLKENRLKTFHKVLFDREDGKKLGKNVSFKNPEVLLFENNDEKITATTSRLLDIQNDYLGYDILVFLQNYIHDKTKSGFNGKAAFKDRFNEQNIPKKIRKRRLESWRESRQLFFKALLKNDLESYEFKCYIQDSTKNDKGYYQLEDLNELLYQTNLDGIYALVSPYKIHVHGNDKISILQSNDGVILINKDGIPLNSDQIITTGYWSSLSLTESLPNDNLFAKEYEGIGLDFKRRYTVAELKSIAKEIKSQNTTVHVLPEIYLETDRLLYFKGETVYATCRIKDYLSNKAMDTNELVHFQLINQEKQIINYKVKSLKDARTSVGFVLPDTAIAGQYVIRAYTDYSNALTEPIEAHTTFGVNLIYQKSNQNQDSIFIDFYPEGENVVPDFENIIGFTAQNKFKEYVPFSGHVVDKFSGNKTPLETLVNGLGSFQITPNVLSQYEIESSKNQVLVVKNKLTVSPEKPSLKISSRDDEFYGVKVIGKNYDRASKIVAKYRGKDVYELDKWDFDKSYGISKDFLPRGLVSFELVNQDGDVISKRLIDNSIISTPSLELKKSYSFFYPRQEVFLEFELDSTRITNLSDWNWDVKIVHDEFATLNGAKEVFLNQNNFINKSDLKQIADVNKSHLKNLESLTFEIKKPYKNKVQNINPKKINTQTIKGQVIDVIDQKPVKAIVDISSMTKDFYSNKIETDEYGKFEFSNLPYLDQSDFVIQARKGIEISDELSDGDRNVHIVIDSMSMDADLRHKVFSYHKNLIKADSLTIVNFSPASTDGLSEVIDEITVTGRRTNIKLRSHSFDLAEEDWVPEESSIAEIISKLYPGTRLRPNPNNPIKHQIQIINRRGVLIWIDFFVVINDGYLSTPISSKILVADQIKYVSLAKNVLAIRTNPGKQRRSVKALMDKGILAYNIPENRDKTSLYDINLESVPSPGTLDNRKTLFWKQGLRYDEIENLKFISSDVTGKYKVQISAYHPDINYLDYSFEIYINAN